MLYMSFISVDFHIVIYTYVCILIFLYNFYYMYILYYKIIRIMNGIYKYLIRNMWQAHLETACCFRIANFSGKPIKLALYISGYKSEDIWATITIHGTRVRQCSLVSPPVFRLKIDRFLAIVMAESSFETHNEDSPVTPTPVQESIYSLRKKREDWSTTFQVWEGTLLL